MWRQHNNIHAVVGAGTSAAPPKLRSSRKLANAPPLACPRYEDPIGDDMDETEQPLGWNECTREEKLDILDAEMDHYWYQIIPPVNWWRFSALVLFCTNVLLMLYI